MTFKEAGAWVSLECHEAAFEESPLRIAGVLFTGVNVTAVEDTLVQTVVDLEICCVYVRMQM